MAIQAQGTVTGVSTKQITSTKSGSPKNYTIHLATVEGLDAVLNTGFKQLYKAGDNFTGLVEKAYGEYKEVKEGAVSPSAPASTPSARPAVPAEGREAFPLDPSHSKNLILRQNAINVASTVLAPTLSKTSTDQVIADRVINIASMLVQWTTGQVDKEALEKLNSGNKVG